MCVCVAHTIQFGMQMSSLHIMIIQRRWIVTRGHTVDRMKVREGMANRSLAIYQMKFGVVGEGRDSRFSVHPIASRARLPRFGDSISESYKPWFNEYLAIAKERLYSAMILYIDVSLVISATVSLLFLFMLLFFSCVS